MTDVVLQEHDQPQEVKLKENDWRTLWRARRGLSVKRLSSDTALVGPREGYVGSVSLSGGRQLVVEPKAPIGGMASLLSLAYQTLAPPSRLGGALWQTAEQTDWFHHVFTSEVEALIGHGLARGYVDVRESLPFVRGRIRPMESLVSPHGYLACEYSDFVTDTPENRLIRGALEVAASLRLGGEIRKRVVEILGSFAGVGLRYPELRDFDQIALTRNNAYYSSTLRLCRLFMEGVGVGEGRGYVSGSAFFVPMWRVFESATVVALQNAGLQVIAQPHYKNRVLFKTGTPSLGIGLNPDIVIGDRDQPDLVVDTKYANPFNYQHGMKRFKNDHVYQLFTYCKALGCPGVLVYPRFDEDVSAEYQLDGVRIGLKTIDLGDRDLSGFGSLAEDLNLAVQVNPSKVLDAATT